MGIYSNFKRRKNDFYPTPYKAMLPLLPHLEPGTVFHEPCCGAGDLVQHLGKHGHLVSGMTDIAKGQDASELTLCAGDMFITNPPWTRAILHPIIENLSEIAPCWLLIDASWMHTKQSIPYIDRCRKIVSIGRVKWIPDTKMSSLSDCCWYLFDANNDSPPAFYRRRVCQQQKK